jgi:hypothetical protein
MTRSANPASAETLLSRGIRVQHGERHERRAEVHQRRSVIYETCSIYPSYESQLLDMRLQEQADLETTHIPMTGFELDAFHRIRRDVQRNTHLLIMDKQMRGTAFMDSAGKRIDPSQLSERVGQQISVLHYKPGDVLLNNTGETLGPDTDPWQHGNRRVVTGVLRRDIGTQDVYIRTAPATHG